jgi:hypothetical protein
MDDPLSLDIAKQAHELFLDYVLRAPWFSLAELPKKFPGIGGYALRYDGEFEIYKPLVRLINEPIYAGVGADSVWERLNTHYLNLSACINLHVEDFRYKHIILPPNLKASASTIEALTINYYKDPVWNKSGFGNKDPGRNKTLKTIFDSLHPGRPAAKDFPRTEDDLLEALKIMHERLKRYN